jgi:ferredoxin-thioredoxin reductase catalytic chain
MSMTPEKLFEALKKIQEPKGCFFNKDKVMTLGLLEGLLATKERYGYMACPCRLPLGTFEEDRDIICPCVYREPDMEEFGACFCGLYVTKEWNEQDEADHEMVPERRPPEKLFGE